MISDSLKRRSIRKLSPALVNRIAAGEVIERPASVVKELIENSLDAGASHIIVEIEDGGLSLIRVIDDGGGIPVEELPLAFASHATSKLESDEDLLAIGTMGFRGEALASIGAVAQVRIVSRTAHETEAHEIRNDGGEIDSPRAAAGNVGTTIEVRNLFFNTPARRKFLKGAGTEFGHIAEAVQRLGMAFANIAIRLLHNGKTVLDWPAAPALQRWLSAWPKEFAAAYLPIEARHEGLQLTGLIGLPELAGPTVRHQHFFLNGRPIRDRIIQHALREAFRGLTEPGRQPAAILMLGVPADDVDVNVHPTKSEVRFRNSSSIHGFVLANIREKLLENDLTPRALAAEEADDPNRATLRQQLADYFRAGMEGTDVEQTNPSAATMAMPASDVSVSPPSLSIAAASAAIPAIQLHNSYLVAQSDDGMIIIDQHALHERIMYEDLLARVSRGPLESQRLLIPPTLPASAAQIALLEQIQPMLRRIGIEADAIGPDAVAIHAFPSFLHRLDPADFVHQLLERGEQESLDLHEEELLHEILDMMACKAAVKAGDPLTPAEIEALLARRHLIDRSSNCPHGRPTTLRLSLHDLEKQFKRTGF